MRTLALAACLMTSLASSQAPLERKGPITRWDEAVPLGNGLTGGLLWGSNGVLRLSLDRGDLWDLREAPGTERADFTYENMKKWVAEKRQDKIDELFDSPYNHAYPTKIPGGRIEFDGFEATSFTLDLKSAEGSVNGNQVRAFFSAVAPVAMVRFSGPVPRPKLIVPAALAKLGYTVAKVETEADRMSFVQQAAAGLTYCVALEVRGQEVAIAIATNRTGDPRKEAFKQIDRALASGYEREHAKHKAWWNKFWAVSSVTLPDPKLPAHYDLVKYFYGSASRKGAPPMPLQGVWTADDGNLPPWKGDYHNDLNTQTTYLPYPTAGLFESGESWTEFNWKLLPTYKKFAKSFYGVEGAVIPGVMTLDGKPLTGWGMYSLSPTNGAWIAHQFERHWKLSGDRKFLRERAYPFCSAIGTALASLLGPDGQLPLSSSPEIHDNTLKAWLKPNSSYDGELMRWLFGALHDMAREMDKPEEAARWRTVQKSIPPSLLDPEDGGFAFSEGEFYRDSHRHFSHAMAVHPLGIAPKATINPTLDRILQHGTQAWTGYSFSWFAGMLARSDRPDQALRFLTDYERAFILPNGFHVNGDQSGTGLSGFTYRPFTLEGNFLFMDAVHEMLIRSTGGVLKVFPAMPTAWSRAEFRDLRAEGGFKVSARFTGRNPVWVRIEASSDAVLKLADPFGPAGDWGGKLEFKNGIATRAMKRGEVLEGRFLE